MGLVRIRNTRKGVRPEMRWPTIFLGCFLRSNNFWLQNDATLRNASRIGMAEITSVSNGVQRNENARKNSVLNYETAALPAELRRHFACKTVIFIGKMTIPGI